MANDCIPIFEPGDRVTVHANVALTGKRFCDIVADAQAGFGLKGLAPDPLAANIGSDIVCGLPTAAGKGFGVVAWDVAAGGKVTVLRGAKMIVPIKSNGAITAGQEVEIATTAGDVKTLVSGVPVGRAVASCSSGADCAISLY
jgi:hypothetical protein